MVKFSSLNDAQKKAVISDSKHIRIIAGAGSGKTRVLTMRIVYLIEKLDVKPFNILAITFTNKAAKEMKTRIEDMLETKSNCFISTIHSLCVRILREDIEILDYPKNFNICDQDDQKSVIKQILKDLNIDLKTFSVNTFISHISHFKTNHLTSTKVLNDANDFEEKIIAQVYKKYEETLFKNKTLDFDDLILKTIKLFKTNEKVLNKWSNRFHHVLVDEFQDVDDNQYDLIKMLLKIHDNLYVVGDPDQTIYSWRGANVDIILSLANDFLDLETIYLLHNYRSSQNILNAANSLISKNKNRIEKDLISTGQLGEKVKYYQASLDQECDFIINKIIELKNKGFSYKDIAILYRANYLSKNIEKKLIQHHIPYIIYGGIKFFERKEIKDIIAYLKLIELKDDISFRRIINEPKRGIGDTTVDKIYNQSLDDKIMMYDVIKNQTITNEKLKSFFNMIENLISVKNNYMLSDFIKLVYEKSGLETYLLTNKEFDRIENINALILDAMEFETNSQDCSLSNYLQEISLYTDKTEKDQGKCISLSTIHMAKGLEYDNLFLMGLIEGVFPSLRTIQEDPSAIEEERRLAYVAITRAKKLLYLTSTIGEYNFTTQSLSKVSRFINEIDNQYIENLNKPTIEKTSKIFDEDFFEIKQEVNKSKRFKRGQLVEHDIFGQGVVISFDQKHIKISFKHPYGIKTLDINHKSITIKN